MASTPAKTGGAIVILLLAFIAFLIYQKVTLAKNLTFGFKKFAIQGNILNPEIYITVTITNTTDITSQLQAVNGNIFTADNVKIASVNSFTETPIEAFKTVDLLLKVDPVITDLITAFQNLLSNPGSSFSFIGSIKADGVTIPVTATTSLKDLTNG